MEKLRIRTPDGLELSVALSEAPQTRGLVQIIHGAKEYKERYFDLIKFLNTQGLTVIISDNRGHGKSINTDWPLGYMDGPTRIVRDQMLVTRFIKKRYPGLPLFMLGHSLGSLFARCYLQQHDNEIDKLIMSGTVCYKRFVSIGVPFAKCVMALSGKHSHSRILATLNGDLNDNSWVCSNEAIMEQYRNDPLCTFDYQNGGHVTIFESDLNIKLYKKYQCKNPNLPILSISGALDPITGGESGLADSIAALRRIGYTNVKNIVYPNMKHEVINEINNQIVYEEIARFFR